MFVVDGYDIEFIKIVEVKNCYMFVIGSIYNNIVICLCVVVKCYIYVYEFNRIKFRYLKIKVIMLKIMLMFVEGNF